MSRAVLAIALFACSKKEPPPAALPAEQPLTGVPSIKRAIESGRLTGPGLEISAKPLPAPTTPGPVYLAVKDLPGVVKIDGGKATRISLPGITYASSLAVDGEQLYLTADKQLYKVTGETLEKLGTPSPEHLGTIVVAPDHVIWGRALGKIYRFDKDKWTAADVKDDTPQAIGFDGAGHVFVHGVRGLYVLDGGSWKTMVDYTQISEEQKYNTPCLTVPAVSPSGELWIASCGDLLRVANGKATFTEIQSGLLRGRFVGDKYFGLAWNKEGLSRLSADGKREAYTESAASSARRAIDGRGRLWSTSDKDGLEVIAPDGKISKYPVGSIAEINGDVVDLVIAETGPDELPAAGAEAARGTISGKVVTNKVPVADANVELCNDPDQSFKKSPCTNKPDRVTGKTDKDGVFKIEAVLRTYRVVVEVGGKWFTPAYGDKGCNDLKPGDVCFMGEMDTARSY
jgi:hypothetical protein